MMASLDRFSPEPDVRERRETRVRAPAEIVLEVARHFDMQSIALVRAIFWLRSQTLRTIRRPLPHGDKLDTDALTAMGWRVLAALPPRHFVAGAVCQPWMADVVFTPIPAELSAEYAEPDRVKIAWTLETQPLSPAQAEQISCGRFFWCARFRFHQQDERAWSARVTTPRHVERARSSRPAL